MLRKKVPLSNDQVDKHGDRMTIDALEMAKVQTNSRIVGSHIEHDFSYPPIGRMEEADILNHEGVNWLIGEFALFEPSDIDKANPLNEREIALNNQEVDTVSIKYDRSYKQAGLVDEVKKLQQIFDENSSTEFEIKKSVEPVSTLTLMFGVGVGVGVGATFAVASFFKGFFGEAGKESWQAFKKLILKNKSINPEADKHYQFIFVCQNEYYKVEVILLFKNPEPEDIEEIIKSNQDLIDNKINQYYEDNIRAGRIVYVIENKMFKHAYSVRRCGTPFDIDDMEGYKSLLNSLKENFHKGT
ncbi:hypothetical protein [Pseudoalteromonas maricaloris]|uniref:hypothetical protein n=1 Tax=Pseudoalteromonas maricaloris TaxID=184924 RepID=UPI00057D433F|nr:hypothetical protein [Pseudoalteromonas flavipulchra]KID37280.1 hypothetical protein QT15_08235 [Pseudoalteromonas flavipulchra NCIMB 2033 = ATCC BAA-314]MBD0784430.1 hypothetical protein [Pseudoalteromonas flavipulchra]MBE0374635.1 hypothetical protein [Pseudoalteromonas flavipulchra NCIMB 2033 = ATCC BAA-314]